MGDVPLLKLRMGIALCQTDFILDVVQSAKCEAGAGLLEGEEVGLVVVIPGDAVVARHHCNFLPSVFSNLDRVCSDRFQNIRFTGLHCTVRILNIVCIEVPLVRGGKKLGATWRPMQRKSRRIFPSVLNIQYWFPPVMWHSTGFTAFPMSATSIFKF